MSWRLAIYAWTYMAEAMDDLQEGMARVTEIQETNNAVPRPLGKDKGTFRFSTSPTKIRRWEMGEAGASAAEGDTEGEQTQEAEGDGDLNRI
jgi:hypothetical protein